MKVDLRIKSFKGGKTACKGFTPYPEHLPQSAIKAKRTKVIAGETFTVPTKEDAKQYLDTGLVEVVL